MKSRHTLCEFGGPSTSAGAAPIGGRLDIGFRGMTVLSSTRSRPPLPIPSEGLPGLLGSVFHRRNAPTEVLVAGEHPERSEGWAGVLLDAGFRISAIGLRLEAVLAAVQQLRPAAFVLDLSDSSRAGLDLAQQIPMRDEFAGLPVLFVLPEPSRLFNGGATRSDAARPAATDAASPPASLLLDCEELVFSPPAPFELAVRLSRMVRSPASAGTGVRAGPITINEAGHRVVVGTSEIRLRKKEYDLLLFLARNAGTVYTREALLRWVWGPGFRGDARTVDVHIRRLRSKLGSPADAVIETVRRVGYRLSDDIGPNSGGQQ